jgi:two-component system response regulator YesN
LASSRFYLGKDNEHNDTHHNPSTSSHSQNFVTRIKRYINQHLADDLSLAALAEEFYINPVYMSRLYKQTTGYNLSEYITHKRIDNSERLLLNTEMKINQIAKECGYDSAAYFTRVFKKQKGMSPQKFRDLHSPPSQDENI